MVLSRYTRRTVVSAVATLCLAGFASQVNSEGIEINGYAQAYGSYSRGEDPKPSTKSSSFNIQEMDLVFQKDLGSALSTFADLQFLNTYSTEKGWGDLNLDQMWIKYSPAKQFNVKFGHIVPTFNAFNEIKTKFPLLPYIFRPLIYEASINAIVNPQEYLPMHAALQVNGTFSASALKLDYALFGGNSDFIVSSKIAGASMYTVPGVDTTNFKLFGGRIGARIADLKLGFSYTYDKAANTPLNNNIALLNGRIQQMSKLYSYPIPLYNKIGKSDRNRIGVDLSYSNFGLTLESEYIYVMNSVEENDKQTLKKIANGISLPGIPPIKTISDDLSRHFFYANINYDILEKFFLTAGYSYMKNSFDLATSKYGYNEIFGGGGFRMSDNVTLKAQCMSIRNDLSKDPMVKLNILIVSAGASVYF